MGGCRLVLTNGARFAAHRATHGGGAMSVKPAAEQSYGGSVVGPYGMTNQSVANVLCWMQGSTVTRPKL